MTAQMPIKCSIKVGRRCRTALQKFSLAPGFSRVKTAAKGESRFNGFSAPDENPLKRVRALPGSEHPAEAGC
jgi:hypothetical protein